MLGNRAQELEDKAGLKPFGNAAACHNHMANWSKDSWLSECIATESKRFEELKTYLTATTFEMCIC